MQAEIISNGDELTSGKILDTNAQWLSRELADLGVTTLYHTTVGDDFEAMVDVLRTATRRADLILWTGGLGPTADDLTRQAIAEVAGVPLETNEESLQRIRDMFQRRGREMPKSNEVQALQPKGSVPIRNPYGTAPGVDLTVKRQEKVPKGRLDFYRIQAYPGVPAEMKEMWHDSGQDSIQKMLDGLSDHKRVIRFRSIHSFGLGESQVEALLPDMINRNHYPKVGITATQGTITLRIAAEAETEAECFKIMEPTAKIIYEKLNEQHDDLIYGEDDDRMEDVVCRLLTEKDKTMAVVEAGTRGLLAEAISHCSDSEKCFAGGIVLPPKQPIVFEEMVRRGRRLFNVDYLLLIGPYPPGQPDRSRTETVFVVVIDLSEIDFDQENPLDWIPRIAAFEKYAYVGHPDIIDDLYIKRGLNLLRKVLCKTV